MPKWLIYSLLTACCFGVWGVISKALGHLSAFQSQAFSTLGVLPILAALLASCRGRAGADQRRGSVLALGAGVLVGMGNIAAYHALGLGGKASTAVSLTSLYPVTTVVLALLVLKEKPSLIQVAGIVGSLVAIFLLTVSQPEEALSGWIAYALLPVALWGSASILMKLSTRWVSTEQATFWFLAAFLPLGLASLLAPGLLRTEQSIEWNLPARDWLLVTLLGATYGVGNLTLLAAYRNQGKASIVTPLTALYPIVTIPLAIIVFDEPISDRALEWVGIALALSSGVALAVETEPPQSAGLHHGQNSSDSRA